MKKEIERLIEEMERSGIGAYVVTSADPHASEYVNAHYKAREFLSGFTGSAGTLLVSAAPDEDGAQAWLWTDGRYFLQAASELAGSGIALMKEGVDGVPALQDKIRQLAGSTPGGKALILGFDGTTMPAKTGIALSRTDNAELRSDLDLAGRIWENRPALKAGRLWSFPESSAGLRAPDKIAGLRSAMEENGADAVLLSDLMETAWLFNLRGNDIDCTPVFYSYAVVTADTVTLYVLRGAFDQNRSGETADVKAGLERDVPGIVIKDYDAFFGDVRGLDAKTLWFDPASASYALYRSLPETARVISRPTPVERMKAVKNETEIRATTDAHVRDAAAVTKFIFWIKNRIREAAPVSEWDCCTALKRFRFAQKGCFGLSFPTIAGYGPNGAVIHYEPTEKRCAVLKPEGFLLLDSGGQYVGGTTDITRTIALGPLTDRMKECYTLVLKGHIALASAVFARGTTGKDLDALARRPLLDRGLDYAHGTGHGVGHVLSVHEGPNYISTRNADTPIEPGMIDSDEPGVYLEGAFGVRLENEILCEHAPGGEDRFCFRPLTVVPFDRAAILPDLLTGKERAWLNDYSKRVRDILCPLLDPGERAWLIAETEPF